MAKMTGGGSTGTHDQTCERHNPNCSTTMSSLSVVNAKKYATGVDMYGRRFLTGVKLLHIHSLGFKSDLGISLL